MEGYATLPDGSRKWLVRIPNWDLNWQGVYRLKTPLTLPKGTVVSMRYHYDNSAANVRNPSHPPQRVRGGNAAADEMSHFWLQVLPASPGDQRADLQEALMRHRLEKYPDDFSANFNLGDLMISRDKPAEAVSYFELAEKADPQSAIAAGELAAALFASSRVSEAKVKFKRALELDPNYIDARYNLASVEASTGEWAEAAVDFKQVLRLNPEHVNGRQHLGEVLLLWAEQLAKSGDRQQAVMRYTEAAFYRPDDVDLHMRLGATLAQMGRFADAKAEIGDALKLRPDSVEIKQALAAVREEESRRRK
jgi:tetratricopeptide (TPR) repeat protein